jgi:hypothetical protein
MSLNLLAKSILNDNTKELYKKFFQKKLSFKYFPNKRASADNVMRFVGNTEFIKFSNYELFKYGGSFFFNKFSGFINVYIGVLLLLKFNTGGIKIKIRNYLLDNVINLFFNKMMYFSIIISVYVCLFKVITMYVRYNLVGVLTMCRFNNAYLQSIGKE